ncbi:hypothetical protein C1646_766148 [Rhizophagus diaphanus]|nr:hypothetical protein C1646_766148 [Rhizophagus diaphanus] [Rhizophagus sp. MUCL 43196]
MAFRRPHPRQRRTCEEYKAKLEEENYHLHSELQTEVDLNRQNEKCLKNASEEEMVKLKSEISSLKSWLYQAKKNSPDLYNPNINLEMATITELANAIDGYVENRITARDILIDQIKRAIRQAERDLAIKRRDLAEGVMDRVVSQAPGREEAFGLVVSCLASNTLNWYDTCVKGKNWKCNNLSDNLGVADLNAVRGLAAGNGDNQIGGKVAAEIGRIGAEVTTGADIIPNGIWDEDWSIAGGEPVNNVPVAPNAGVEHLKQTAVFGQFMQGDMSVEQFFAQIKKDNITKALAEAEKYILSQKSAPSSIPPQQNTDLQAIAKSFQETMSQATKTLYGQMTLNSATINAIKSAVRSAVKKCTKCGRFGHTSCKCSVKKKRKSKKLKKSKVNLTIEPDSDSDSSSNDTSFSNSSDSDTSFSDSSDSDSDLNAHIAKLKKNVSSQNNVLSSTKDSDESSLKEESLDDLMEIYFIQKKEPKTSVTTVKCKIKCLKIPAMTLDSRAEPPIITNNIVERIGAKINKSEIHDLESISTVLVKSIEVVRNLPITLAPGFIIIEDFIIMRYRKSTLIFSNKLLKKYGCAVDWSTEELKIPFNGKDYIIPATMHKVKNKLEEIYRILQDSFKIRGYNARLQSEYINLNDENRRLKVENFKLVSQNTCTEISLAKAKADNFAKSEEVKSLQSVINLLILKYFNRSDSHVKSGPIDASHGEKHGGLEGSVSLKPSGTSSLIGTSDTALQEKSSFIIVKKLRNTQEKAEQYIQARDWHFQRLAVRSEAGKKKND